MEKMTIYRKLVHNIMERYMTVSISFPHEGVERLVIMDDERGHYMLMQLGWQGQKRVRGITIYLRVKSDKIWIEQDLTEDGIATELLAAGVPNEDIVLAFHAPEMRQYTDFAAA